MSNRETVVQTTNVSSSLSSSRSHIRFEHVSLQAYLGPRYLLHDLSFNIMEGDRLVIVGPSGAGKTSLLRLMNRLHDPSEGTIFYGDRALYSHAVLTLRQSIPLVLQEPCLLDMSVRDALMYPLILRQVEADTMIQRLQCWMERLHIPSDWLQRSESQLSVGQRQVVAIARALMLQPKTLLLDEPISALDVGRRDHLVKVLLDYARTSHCTMVMVSHDLAIAQQFCSKLLYLVNGQMVQYCAQDDVDWPGIKDAIIQAEHADDSDWEDDELSELD